MHFSSEKVTRKYFTYTIHFVRGVILILKGLISAQLGRPACPTADAHRYPVDKLEVETAKILERGKEL